MVEYLSGGRIQGSSALEASADFTDNFTSDNWTYSRAGTEIQITGGKMVFTDFQNGGQWRSAYRSTGLDVNDTKWVLRFKFRFSAASSQSFWILGLSSGTSNPTGSSEYIVGAYFVDTPYMEIAKKSSSDSYRSWTGGNVFNPSADTDYYIQIIRTGETEVQMKMFTNSNFSDGLVGTNTQTIDSNYAGLDYLMISNQSNGSNTRTMTGEIDDIQIWNGVTTTTEDEKDSLTNVPANSRYEETDTRKIFRRTAGTQSYNSTTTNVTLSNSNLTATSTSTAWGNRAYSTVSYNPTNIPSGETREFKFTMGDITKNGFMGFDSTPTTISGHGNDNNASGVDYGMYLVGNGSSNNYLEVSEQGTNKYQSSSNFITSNTIFKITVDSSGVVKYYADATDGTTLLYTSLTAMSGDFYVLFYPYDSGFTTTITSWSNNPEWKERNTV